MSLSRLDVSFGVGAGALRGRTCARRTERCVGAELSSQARPVLAHELVEKCLSWASGARTANRLGSSSGAGHTGTENVFWGSTGRGQLRSFQFGWGYVVATGRELRVTTDGVPWEQLGTEPLDWLEGEGRAEDRVPASLYEDQLARRLAR